MSGGSLNYLYVCLSGWNDPAEILSYSRKEDLERLRDTLKEMGHEEASNHTQKIIDRTDEINKQISKLYQEMANDFAEVTKSVEWCLSNDSGPDDVKSAVEAWQKNKR